MVWVSSLKIVKGQINQKVMLDKKRCNFFFSANFKVFHIFPWHLSHKTLGKAYFFRLLKLFFSCLTLWFWSQAAQKPLKPWASLGGKGFRSAYGFGFVVTKLEQITQVSSKLNRSSFGSLGTYVNVDSEYEDSFFPLLSIYLEE